MYINHVKKSYGLHGYQREYRRNCSRFTDALFRVLNSFLKNIRFCHAENWLYLLQNGKLLHRIIIRLRSHKISIAKHRIILRQISLTSQTSQR